MHEKAKAAILQQLQFAAQEAVSIKSPRTPDRRRPIRLETDAGPLLLENEAAETYDKVVDDLLKNRVWSQRFSKLYLRTRFAQVVGGLRRDANLGKQALDSLVNELDTYSTEITVYMPLYGFDIFDLKDEQFELGPFKLVKMTDARVDDLINRIESVTLGPKPPRFEDLFDAGDYILNVAANTTTQQALTQAIEDIRKLQDHVCMEFAAVADLDKSWERAEDAVRVALDLLTFALPKLFPPNMVHIGLAGEEWDASFRSPVIASDSSAVKFKFRRTEGIYPFVIVPNTIAPMRELGVFEVAKLLERSEDQRTDLERILLRAIHWFADAQRQQSDDNRFLSLMICLECFFTPEGSEPITRAVSEGVAFLIGNHKEERKRLYRDVVGLYGVRSAIAHGRQNKVTKSQMQRLQSIASQVISHFAFRTSQFTNITAVRDWIEDLKFS